VKTSDSKKEKEKGSVKLSTESAKKMNQTKAKGGSDTSKGKGKTPVKSSSSASSGSSKGKDKGKEKNKDSSVKKSRFAGLDKGDAPNSATAYINGTFNVNTAKKELKTFITETLGHEEYGTNNAQYAYSAIAEVLMLAIVRASLSLMKKNKKQADMFEVSFENLSRCMKESHALRKAFKNKFHVVEEFDPASMNYSVGFFESSKTIRSLIEGNAFPNTNNIHVSNDAINYLCYIVRHCLAELTQTACEMCEFAKKKNVGIRTFIYACNIHFSDDVRNLLNQRLLEIDMLFSNKKAEAKEDDSEGKEEKSKSKAKSKSKNEDDDEDDEAEDDEAEDDDEDEDDEDDEADDDDDDE